MFRKPLYAGALALGSALAAAPASATSTLNESPVEISWQKVENGEPSYETWVRREPDGNISCFSTDGVHCRRDVSNPNDAWWTSQTSPLVCGQKLLKSEWNLSGYNDALEHHWCRTAHAVLLPPSAWTDYTLLGHDKLLAETPDGDLMCFSTDGKECSSVRDGKPVTSAGNVIPLDQVQPVVCGAFLHMRTGGWGYEKAGHWCTLPKIVKREVGKVLDRHDDLVLDLPPWTPEDLPSVIVRTDLKAGFPLEIRMDARFKQPYILGTPKVPRGTVGFTVGGHNALHIDDEVVPVLPSVHPVDSPTFALSVSEQGNMCLFSGPTESDRLSAVSEANFLEHAWGSAVKSWQYARDWGRLVHLEGSPEHETTTVRIKALPEGPPSVTLHEVLILTARDVPEPAGAASGVRRKVPYLRDCGEKNWWR